MANSKSCISMYKVFSFKGLRWFFAACILHLFLELVPLIAWSSPWQKSHYSDISNILWYSTHSSLLQIHRPLRASSQALWPYHTLRGLSGSLKLQENMWFPLNLHVSCFWNYYQVDDTAKFNDSLGCNFGSIGPQWKHLLYTKAGETSFLGNCFIGASNHLISRMEVFIILKSLDKNSRYKMNTYIYDLRHSI